MLEEQIERSIKAEKPPSHRAEWEKELYGGPELPLELAYLWRAYKRLSRRRSNNGFGVNPISWPEIDAFVRHAKFPLAPWEVEVIEDLDDLERIALAKFGKTEPEPEQ